MDVPETPDTRPAPRQALVEILLVFTKIGAFSFVTDATDGETP